MAEEEGQRAGTRARTAPHPDDPRKPDEISDIRKPSWLYIARKTIREFSTDQATDLAAALTYYGVLAIFPALLAFVSLLGLFGDPSETTDALLELAGPLVPASTLDAVREPIAQLASQPAAGFTFVVGVVGALWSASGYVAAFSRAMNRIYAIQEGRPFWKLRPVTLAVTVLAIVLAVVAAVLVAVGGPVATVIGDAIGLGDAFVAAWNVLRWPVLVLLAVVIIAVLYYATPNVQQPKFRWMSVGAFVALVAWALASAGFALYAANFASYDETYGTIGGIIVFLLWVWISNLALLFGAELDAELERGRQLQAGIPAEEHLQLPPRDTKQSDKIAAQHEKDVRAGRRLRGAPTPTEDEVKEQHEREAEADPEAERKDQDKTRKDALKSLRRTNRMQATALRKARR